MFEESPDENADGVAHSLLEPETLLVSVKRDMEWETNPTVVLIETHQNVELELMSKTTAPVSSHTRSAQD